MQARAEPLHALLARLEPKLGRYRVGEGLFLVGLVPRFVLLISVQESRGDLPKMQGQHSVARFKTDAPAQVGAFYAEVLE